MHKPFRSRNKVCDTVEVWEKRVIQAMTGFCFVRDWLVEAGEKACFDWSEFFVRSLISFI